MFPVLSKRSLNLLVNEPLKGSLKLLSQRRISKIVFEINMFGTSFFKVWKALVSCTDIFVYFIFQNNSMIKLQSK